MVDHLAQHTLRIQRCCLTAGSRALNKWLVKTKAVPIRMWQVAHPTSKLNYHTSKSSFHRPLVVYLSLDRKLSKNPLLASIFSSTSILLYAMKYYSTPSSSKILTPLLTWFMLHKNYAITQTTECSFSLSTNCAALL